VSDLPNSINVIVYRNKTWNSKLGNSRKIRRWSEAITVGSLASAAKVKGELSIDVKRGEVEQASGSSSAATE